MWIYQTPIGLLKIQKFQTEYFFLLGEDPTPWTGHSDPRIVADDVYCHATGCPLWDISDITAPADLSDWKHI